jgi:hypothetical protein
MIQYVANQKDYIEAMKLSDKNGHIFFVDKEEKLGIAHIAFKFLWTLSNSKEKEKVIG